MKKSILLFIGCLFICLCIYRFCDLNITQGIAQGKRQLYDSIHTMFVPQIVDRGTDTKQLVFQELEQMVFPVFSYGRNNGVSIELNGNLALNEDMTEGITETELSSQSEANSETEIIETEKTDTTTTPATETVVGVADTKKVVINRVKLQDFDYLRQNFYQVDNTTTVDSSLLDVTKLLEKDMSLSDATEGPQVLIYHTHSQEGYVGSVEGDASSSVVAIGDYLTELLTEQYGIRVLHHKGEYDVGDREHAYSNALPGVEQVLKENPSIELVIDLHRDGVPDNLHLATEIDGRPTAKIMFFNGLSRTTSQGELTYLPNPYIENNLALSFQLQLMAEEYYPGLARRIYLKGYRYNQHICSKCLLVEVGAQNNSFEEARNAMIPLADILAKVLKPE